MGWIGWSRGRLPDDARACVLAARGDSAADYANDLRARLVAAGYDVTGEVPVTDRGDGRRGRVDLVATRGGETVAIECDRLSPRRKSVVKLGQIEGASALVVALRGNTR
jgi:Holliday junction resolvase